MTCRIFCLALCEPKNLACRCGDMGNNDESDNAWGDKCEEKPEDVIRIAFQNIQGLPINPYSNKHTQQIADLINTQHIDSLGLAELNLNFPQLQSSAQWRERFRGIEHKYTHHCTNIHHNTQDKILFGGRADGLQ